MLETLRRMRAARTARWAAPAAAAAILLAGGGAIANASSHTGRGTNEFGMTMGSYQHHTSTFTYTHGFYCDTSVKAVSTTGCEVGERSKVPPAKHFDPLFITVPLGFSSAGLDCPARLVCVDHPMTVDMTRLAPALAPLFKTTPEKLAPALRNFTTPGHDHFVTDLNKGKSEWWDVRVVGVTDPKVYAAIQKHHSYGYIAGLIKAKNKAVVGPIPTNLFLFFKAS
jgi:hypothetical protein